MISRSIRLRLALRFSGSSCDAEEQLNGRWRKDMPSGIISRCEKSRWYRVDEVHDG